MQNFPRFWEQTERWKNFKKRHVTFCTKKTHTNEAQNLSLQNEKFSEEKIMKKTLNRFAVIFSICLIFGVAAEARNFFDSENLSELK